MAGICKLESLVKNLILAAVGEESLHKNWIAKEPQFDLFLVYYGDKPNRYKEDAKHYLQRKGNKYIMFHDLITYKPEIFDPYDRVLIMDDDLYTETSHLNNFFEIFEQNEFELAQPSIIGYYTHEITLHDPKWLWRCTNFVEIMCPCFSKNALNLCKETFIESEIGWGIDWAWTKLLGFPKNKIAIVDEAIVFHTRPVKSGDFYKNNNLEKLDSMKELQRILDKYEVKPEYENYYDHSKWKNINFQESKNRIYPHLDCFKDFLNKLRLPNRIQML